MDCVGPLVIDQSCSISLTEVTQLLDVDDKFQLKIISACNLNVGKDALVSTSTPTHPSYMCTNLNANNRVLVSTLTSARIEKSENARGLGTWLGRC